MSELADIIEAICAESLSLFETAKALPEVFDAAFSTGQGLVEVTVRDDSLAASGALKLVLGAKGSDRALDLLTAVRTANADLSVVKEALGHISSPVGCDNATVEAPAGRFKALPEPARRWLP